jgi:5-methylcytosine-specific restriction endonuclease McrA
MIGQRVPRMTARESKEGYSRVAERSFGLCEGCGKVQATQMHHRLYRSQGGDERPENLLHLCLECHQSAHQDSDRYVIGWAIESRGDPAEVWVVYRGRPTLLTSDGGLA